MQNKSVWDGTTARFINVVGSKKMFKWLQFFSAKGPLVTLEWLH